MYFVGLLIGSLIGGYPADKFGRKPVLFFFIFIGGFSTLTGGLVSNFVLYTLFRAMAGIGEQVPNLKHILIFAFFFFLQPKFLYGRGNIRFFC
jgi:MFS family permease